MKRWKLRPDTATYRSKPDFQFVLFAPPLFYCPNSFDILLSIGAKALRVRCGVKKRKMNCSVSIKNSKTSRTRVKTDSLSFPPSPFFLPLPLLPLLFSSDIIRLLVSVGEITCGKNSILSRLPSFPPTSLIQCEPFPKYPVRLKKKCQGFPVLLLSRISLSGAHWKGLRHRLFNFSQLIYF